MNTYHSRKRTFASVLLAHVQITFNTEESTLFLTSLTLLSFTFGGFLCDWNTIKLISGLAFLAGIYSLPWFDV